MEEKNDDVKDVKPEKVEDGEIIIDTVDKTKPDESKHDHEERERRSDKDKHHRHRRSRSRS